MYYALRRLARPFARTGNGRQLRVLDVWGRAASVGVTAVLLLLALFALHAAGTTDGAAAEVQVATALNHHLQGARYAVAAEESLERKYRLHPGPDISRFHRDAAASLEDDLRAVARIGAANDRAFAAEISQANRAYMASSARMFAAVDRHQSPLVAAIDAQIDPAFEDMQRRTASRAALQERRASQALDELRTSQRHTIKASALLSLLGVACLAIVFFIFGAYRRDIAAAHAAEVRQLEDAALTDHLTKLGNHRAYQEDLHREISRAKRHGHDLTLALIDVDDLKLLNDQGGHLHGDRVLGALGSLLGSLRHEDRAYRIGGDEFSVLFPQTSNADARETMERLRLRAQESLLGATISGGIATLSPDCDAETLHAQADAALYASKRRGRNGFTLYQPDATGLSVVSPAQVSNLKALIAERGLGVVYQPIWDVKRAEVLAYEALARPAARYGFAGPQAAFDLAERVGCAPELDAVARFVTLAGASSLPDSALLFINMSPQSFARRRLDVASITEEVCAAGFAPGRLVIEITERSIANLGEVVALAKELQQAGFRLALDDVGSGNAGLEMLSELNVDFVKIDRSIILKAGRDDKARGVLARIVVIAKATGAYVIAEGIESIEMLDLVCRATVDWHAMERGIQGAQGYLLRRPSDGFLDARETSVIRALVRDTLALEDDATVTLNGDALARRWEQFA
ncbi:MAG: bifunctional diguanylate cyclase/phosphodiesterase [Candidatus Eremiobacteraeota bacterium]|nr:bifunctional diguanylate cyclase/phosphodiesterase [Candidatus Eremiobacteraeota bacterium]